MYPDIPPALALASQIITFIDLTCPWPIGIVYPPTAGFIDPGFEGSLVLELVATRTIRLYPNMKICLIEFARVEGQIKASYDQKTDSKYHGQVGVQESKYHENYK
jgi:deoxycytidine triphosphate deaminase